MDEVRPQEVDRPRHLHGVDPGDQILEHHTQLDPSQRISKTHMRTASTEGHVLIRISSDVEFIRTVEDRLITIP